MVRFFLWFPPFVRGDRRVMGEPLSSGLVSMSRMALSAVALLLAAIASPFASGEPTEAMRPIAAFAIGTAAGATVAWVPGPEAPDFFRIYGVRNETLAFLTLADAGAVSAEVEGKFPQYAVTAVRGGVESEPALAVFGVGLACVTVDPGIPPSYGVDTSCVPARTWIRVRAL